MLLTAQCFAVPPRRLFLLPPLICLLHQPITKNLRKTRAQMPLLSIRRHERIDIRRPRSSTAIHPADINSEIPNGPWSKDETQTFAKVILSVWMIGFDVDREDQLYVAKRDLAEVGVIWHLTLWGE